MSEITVLSEECGNILACDGVGNAFVPVTSSKTVSAVSSKGDLISVSANVNSAPAQDETFMCPICAFVGHCYNTIQQHCIDVHHAAWQGEGLPLQDIPEMVSTYFPDQMTPFSSAQPASYPVAQPEPYSCQAKMPVPLLEQSTPFQGPPPGFPFRGPAPGECSLLGPLPGRLPFYGWPPGRFSFRGPPPGECSILGPPPGPPPFQGWPPGRFPFPGAPPEEFPFCGPAPGRFLSSTLPGPGQFTRFPTPPAPFPGTPPREFPCPQPPLGVGYVQLVFDS